MALPQTPVAYRSTPILLWRAALLHRATAQTTTTTAPHHEPRRRAPNAMPLVKPLRAGHGRSPLCAGYACWCHGPRWLGRTAMPLTQTGWQLFMGTSHLNTGVDTSSGNALVVLRGSWVARRCGNGRDGVEHEGRQRKRSQPPMVRYAIRASGCRFYTGCDTIMTN